MIRCKHSLHHHEWVNQFNNLSDLLPQDMIRTLADIKPLAGNAQMLAAAIRMIETPSGCLWLWGNPGNAKTEVLIAIVNEVNQAGRGPALYLKFSTLINYMRDAFSEKKSRASQLEAGRPLAELEVGNYLTRFNRLKEIKLIAIDEIDKVNITAFVDEFRFDFFDERYRQAIHHQTATVFAGQSPPDDPAMPHPLSSRFTDGRFVVVHNRAGDARPDMGQ